MDSNSVVPQRAGTRVRTLKLPNGNAVTVADAIQAAVQLHQAGQLQKASVLYDLVLQSEPENADALHLNGVVAHQCGRHEAAAVLIGRAIASNPDVAMYHNNLGETYLAMNRACEAIAECEKALKLQFDSPETFYVMGRALLADGRPEEAATFIERFLSRRPDFIDAYMPLVAALCRQNKAEAALARCRKALALHPDHAVLLCAAGIALSKLGRTDEVIAHYRQALLARSNFAEAHHNLANVLAAQGRVEEAITHYEKALALNPDYADTNSALLMCLNYIPRYDAMAVYRAHLKFAERHEAPLAASIRPPGNDRSCDRRLRIGYVSSDFRQHAVAHFIEPVLRHHDHDRFEVFCYSSHDTEDDVTRRMRPYVDQWRNIVRLPNEAVAQLIRDDKIDILVDLNGHTAYNRLRVFARKPAPVQVTWLGYPNTTGLSTMDYRITDEYADPVGLTEGYHSEKLIRLPGSFSCYAPLLDCPEVAELPARRNGFVTFGSFNNLAKVTPEVISLWASILRAIPGACLMIKNKILNEPARREVLRDAFSAHGVAAERLKLLGHSASGAEHFEQYNSIDIGLDPFPYNGSTTTCDALWMGVPVITLAGTTHVARVGVSQLSSIGMTELIARTPDDYVAIATRLAHDLNTLEKIRKELRAKMSVSPLVNAPVFTRNLEQAYRAMYEKWLANNSR
ncbi:tetratricopeptide repeat protein [Sulfuricaulis sp.]|uniref:O-linked N-acetylglucosamine transferase, SPINDLY family protein n=1 Tax=Sulfuricaulis sp. TaxID=2003553 RepID=UPI003559BD1A